MWENALYTRKLESRFYPSKERLAASYESCEASGVSRNLNRLRVDWNETQIQASLSTHLQLVRRAERLFSQAHALLADRTSVFLLTDHTGRVLCLYSVRHMIDRCAKIGLRPGASLAEMHSGTNAVALALRYHEPIVLRGRQHFCRCFFDWYCVAAPVLDDDGQLAACIDLSTHDEAGLGEKLSLVTVLAARIEERIHGSDRADTVLGDWTAVSPRQRTILEMVTGGLVAKEIAVNLGISQRTVESHLEKLRKKFHAKTTVELVAKLGTEKTGGPART